MNHRDHIQAIQAKRWQEAVDDDEAARLEALLAADQQRQQEPVGHASYMPGTSGFTMVCFKSEDVPVGTAVYTNPNPSRQCLGLCWRGGNWCR